MTKIILVWAAAVIILVCAIVLYIESRKRRETADKNRRCEYCEHYKKTHIDRVSESGIGRCNLADIDGGSDVFVRSDKCCGNFKRR